MRPGQWFGWQLRYFPWIYLNKRLLLWPRQPLWLVISKHFFNISTPRFDFLLIENQWKRLGLQLKDEIHFQFDFYRMRWWKWRTYLLHKLTPMWGRGRRLWHRRRLCWQFEMWSGQWFEWQLQYFHWISIWLWLLLWPKQPLRLVISKRLWISCNVKIKATWN